MSYTVSTERHTGAVGLDTVAGLPALAGVAPGPEVTEDLERTLRARALDA
ncbi:MAG: hypothetical protein ACRDYC_08435 [Acidimicrobiales bacterium]